MALKDVAVVCKARINLMPPLVCRVVCSQSRIACTGQVEQVEPDVGGALRAHHVALMPGRRAPKPHQSTCRHNKKCSTHCMQSAHARRL